MSHLLRLAVALRPNRMLAIALGLLLTLVGRTMAQPTLSIGPNTRLVGTGAVQLVYGGGSLTNAGSLSLPAGQLTANGPTTYTGTGTGVVATAVFTGGNNGYSTLNSLLSVTDQATVSANSLLNASNGQLYLRTDQFPNANLVNDGYLNGTVQGLVTKATVTSGNASYTSQLSTNVSGSVMRYQWQSSADNSQWSNVPGATSAMYTASVDATMYYRCLLTASNNCYYQFTPGVQLVVTATKPVAPTLPNQTATVGTYFSYMVPAFTGTAPISYGASGLPDGLVFYPATRTIAGTPNTVQTPTVTITATNAADQGSGQFTITVNPAPVVTNLTVLQRDPDNGQLFTNTLKPYLQLRNDGTTAIPYSEITVRYWLTVEDPAPIVAQVGSQLGNGNVVVSYVPISPARQGADGYLEFSFSPGAGRLPASGNSGEIQTSVRKENYSLFNQGNDYSYVLNRDLNPNIRITAYRNGQLVYGTEPGGVVNAPLTVALTANPTTITTAGTTTLSAMVGGGMGPYGYSFSGPGTITPNGNTATVSNLPVGIQTFTVRVVDMTQPSSQTTSASVSVQVNPAPPANTAPVATANTNQTATVGQAFTYTVNAFTDQETPNNLTYTASIRPANGLTFNPGTRVILGTPMNTGVSSVTITATDPGGLSASTIFTITVNPAPVVVTPLALTFTASPAMIQTTGTTTLSATVSGGTGPYSYVFSGPGTIAQNGTRTATVSNLPAGVQTFTVVVSDATQPTSQTLSGMVNVTVSAAPVATQLTVLQRDPDNGQLNTNTLKPYLQLRNDGTTAIPYSEITVRYWLTVEEPAPIVAQVGSQLGNGNVTVSYVPLSPVRPGATGYLAFSFTAGAGSLAGGANSGDIQTTVRKENYSGFNQGDDYSYVLNRDFAANPRITAYRNGTLIYGTEPPVGARLGAEKADVPLRVTVLGNPVREQLTVIIGGAEGQALELRLSDISGHVVATRRVIPASSSHREVFDVQKQGAGLLLLQVMNGGHSQTLKVMKE